MRSVTRRDLLKAVPLAALPFTGRAFADEARPFPGMTVRMQEPRNLEFPFTELKTWLTPTEQFFVRSHFAVPKVDSRTYKLTVEGAVENRLELSLDEIRKLPSVTSSLTLECAGNGRVFLVPQARGLQWGLGAVGNAEWTGVPLGAILERAKVKPGAVEVVLVGADKGALTADPATPGTIHFERSLPLAKARKPEVLVAYQQNGEDLTPSHGAPLRAVVGGWYGVASVKWLTRIVVVEKPHTGYWQTFDYSYFTRGADALPVMTAVTAVQPKASIARPAFGDVLPVGKPYRLFGAAWAGESPVARVDISSDGGRTWSHARLVGEAKPFCWRMWEFTWTPGSRGPAKLMARANDSSGATQPDSRDPDRRSYMINHLVPVEVVVR